MSTPIQETYSELRDIVIKNPQSLSVYEKLNSLTKLVHEQIVENIKWVYWDSWEKSSTYASFQNNVNERAQMERNVLKKELGVSISIIEINQQISMAMMTAMTDSPNIFNSEIEKANNSNPKPIEAPKQIEESLNPQQIEELVEPKDDAFESLKKNKEIVLRLVRDKKSKWFALRKNSDFTKFYIELDWKRISYNQIAELFLWKWSLNTHDNTLRVHTRLTEQLFDEESIDKWYDGFRDAIKEKGDWLDLENYMELRNTYVVGIWGDNYTYRNLIAIFWINIKNTTLLSHEVYKELSAALFWKNWKHNLKALKEPKKEIEQNQRNSNRDQIEDFEDENVLKKLCNQKEELKTEEPKVDTRKVGVVRQEIEEWISIENIMIHSKKKSNKELEKEKEYNNNRRMVVALALEAMDQNPELKKLWFWPVYSERWQRLFNFEYEWEQLTLRRIAELTGLYWINKKIPFPIFIEQIFGKQFVELMRVEIANDEAKKEYLEKVKKQASQTTETLIIEWNNKATNKPVENPDNEEKPIVETEEEKKTKILIKILEDSCIYEVKANGLDPKKVLWVFDKIVEECIKLDKENIDSRINLLITKERWSVVSQCKKKYPKADPALKHLCKNEKFIWDCKTEFLLIKQDEVRTKIMKFFSDWNVSQSKNFYWGLVKGLQNLDFAQDCYDHIIDSLENKYRASHQDDDKGIINELRAQEDEYKKDLREKEIETYCKNNGLTREQYTALVYLIKNLKRKKNGQDMEKYLLKLKSRKESLRGEEFDNDFSDEMIDALKKLWIKLASKDSPKRKNKKPN